jgi:hypothetical protein
MPSSMWWWLWQWNSHRPGLVATKSKLTSPPPAGTATVSFTGPRPVGVRTSKWWPCRCIGCHLALVFRILTRTHSPSTTGNGSASG